MTALPGYVTVETVTPRDLCRFLIFKDKDGKPKSIVMVVGFSAKKEDLIVGAQYGSLTKQSTLYRQAKSHFHAIGRGGDWDKRLGFRQSSI